MRYYDTQNAWNNFSSKMLNEDDNMVGTDHEMPTDIDNADNEYGGFVRNDSSSGITSAGTTSGTSSVRDNKNRSASLILAANIVSTSRGNTEIVDQIIEENKVDDSMKMQDRKVDDFYEENPSGESGNVRVKFSPESAMSLPSSGDDTQKLDDSPTESDSVSSSKTDIEIDNNEQKETVKEKMEVILDSGRKELEDPPSDTSIKLEAPVKVASASIAANIHSYHSNAFLPFSIIPQNELPDACDVAVDAILALLQPQKAQEVYRASARAFLGRTVRHSLNAKMFEIGLHALQTFLPDDPIRLSVLLWRGNSTNWLANLSDKLKGIVEQPIGPPGGAGSLAGMHGHSFGMYNYSTITVYFYHFM
jgi:hypothetical protein